jgi:hypothetical protein
VHSVMFSDAFSRTHARIIRLRFPAWTIWNLPLVAHEVGHVAHAVVLNQERDQDDSLQLLTSFMASQRDSVIENDTDLSELHKRGGEQQSESERLAHSRLRVLLADAFATYTMGPAYACSAIMLRLNPAVEAPRDMPSDIRRAHVILSMLHSMNGADGSLSKPYDLVIKRLEDSWEKALDRSAPTSKLTASDAGHLSRLAEAFTRDVAPQIFTTAARYPHTAPRDGWTKAQEWGNNWWAQCEKGESFSVPENPSGKLRDVLNAVWFCRLSITDNSKARNRVHKDLADAATDLCRTIIDRPRSTRTLTGSARVGS